jgi:hypothetical protein
MSRAVRNDYGSRLLDLWRADLRDRLRGARARANARWGFLRPPPGRGRLVWVMADSSRASVRLAVDVLRALREKRLDLRLVLTFEHEYPELLERTGGLERCAVGYGPADVPAAVRRALESLEPIGVVFVRRPVPAGLAAALAARAVHAVALNAPPPAFGGKDSRPTACRLEAVYPSNQAEARGWGRVIGVEFIALAADFLSLLAAAQVEPRFHRLVSGTAREPRPLWWVQGLDAVQAAAWVTAWRASPLARQGVLCLGPGENEDAGQAAWAAVGADVRLSRWPRTPLSAGSIVLVDEDRWWPALAAAASGIHLGSHAGVTALWQALAGGAPVSVADRDSYLALEGNGAAQSEVSSALHLIADPIEVLTHWREYADDVPQARRAGDRVRRLLWQVRRRAQVLSADFLERVYDW